MTTPTEPMSLPRRAGVRPPRWLLVGVAAVAVTAAAVTAAVRSRHTSPPTAPAALVVDGDRVDIRAEAPTWGYVKLAQAAAGPPAEPAPVPGRVAFDEARATTVTAPLLGRVDTVVVRFGQRVHAGDRLLSVRSAALVDLFREIDLLRAKETARAQTVDRLRDLARLRAIPEKDLIAAQQDLHQVQVAREANEAKLRSLSVDAPEEGLYWVVAPRPGVIVQRDVLVGQEVGPDRGDPLLVLADLDEVIVTADVPEADILGVDVGEPATISSPALQDRTLPGTVEHVADVIDPTRRMVNVRVRVPNPEHALRANAFVQVGFHVGGAPRVTVATEAVVTDDQQSFVFVQVSGQPTGLERRPVVTGRQYGGTVEILKGLAPGETYVSQGAILLLNAVDLAR